MPFLFERCPTVSHRSPTVRTVLGVTLCEDDVATLEALVRCLCIVVLLDVSHGESKCQSVTAGTRLGYQRGIREYPVVYQISNREISSLLLNRIGQSISRSTALFEQPGKQFPLDGPYVLVEGRRGDFKRLRDLFAGLLAR